MSTYNNTIPVADERLADSQPKLLGNFGDLETAVTKDHVSLLASSVETMKHKIVKLKDQTANLPYATLADEGALYPKVVSGQDDLYYKHFNDGPEVKLTGGGSSGGNVLAFFYATYNATPNTYTIQYQSNIAALTVAVSIVKVDFTTALTSPNYVVLLQSGFTRKFSSSNSQLVKEGTLATTGFEFDREVSDGIFCTVIG